MLRSLLWSSRFLLHGRATASACGQIPVRHGLAQSLVIRRGQFSGFPPLKDEGEDDATRSPPPPVVLNSLTPELASQLVENVTARKFKLKLIQEELTMLNLKEFPLPEKLTAQQWRHLMLFKDREIRTRYLDSLVRGQEERELQMLQDLDEQYAKGFTFSVGMFEDVASANIEDLDDKVRKIQHVYEDLRQRGELIPVSLTLDQKKELLQCRSEKSVEKTFQYFAQLRQTRVTDLIKKRARQTKGKALKEIALEQREAETHLFYGLGKNSMFLRFLDRTLDAQEHWNVIREFHHWGQPLVIDMQFVKEMNYKQAKSLMFREILHGLNRNKKSRSPFPIYLCNFDRSCEKCAFLLKAVPTILDPEYPVVCTDKSYLDLFPKERLLYLTPDSKSDLMEFNEDDVYIIGGLVDGTSGIARTLAQAKKENIRHARLPLRRFVGLAPELNIDHMIAIMADFRVTKDWFYAFRWLPPRFFRNRIISTGRDARNEAIYKAHSDLSPQNNAELEDLPVHEYRKRYGEILGSNISAIVPGREWARSSQRASSETGPIRRKASLSDLLSS